VLKSKKKFKYGPTAAFLDTNDGISLIAASSALEARAGFVLASLAMMNNGKARSPASFDGVGPKSV